MNKKTLPQLCGRKVAFYLTWIKATAAPRNYTVSMLRDRTVTDLLLLSPVKMAAIAAIYYLCFAGGQLAGDAGVWRAQVSAAQTIAL